MIENFSLILGVQNPDTISALVTNVETLRDLIVVLISSMVGGAAKTSNYLRKLKIVQFKTSFRQFVEDSVGAIVAGLIVYFFAEGTDINIRFEILLLLVAGYAGSTLTDAVSNKMVKEVDNK